MKKNRYKNYINLEDNILAKMVNQSTAKVIDVNSSSKRQKTNEGNKMVPDNGKTFTLKEAFLVNRRT